MPFAYDSNPVRVTDMDVAADETRIGLALDLDPGRWPWMALDPQHPVVVEKLQYLEGMTALMATGAMADGIGSALTRLTWSIGDGRPTGHATEGVCRLLGSFASVVAGGEGSFELDFRDAAGTPIVAALTGAGVVFDATDSKGRREAAKAKVQAAGGAPPVFVDPETVGLPANGVSFLGSRVDGGAAGWVASERGFHPSHPFHTGTGDHVNAGHLLDVGLQFAHLELGRPVVWVAGEARFRRFVELDAPFVVTCVSRTPGEGAETLTFAIAQLGRPCAQLEGTFRFA